MLFAALILRAWAAMIGKEENVAPYLFVDYVMLMTEGCDEEEVLKGFT